MKFLPSTRQVQLENSNPEKLVSASKGTYFYRIKNDVFYLITNGARKRIEMSKRGFALPYKNEIWFATIKDSDIVFQYDYELWEKVGSGFGNSGWKYISNKPLDTSNV